MSELRDFLNDVIVETETLSLFNPDVDEADLIVPFDVAHLSEHHGDLPEPWMSLVTDKGLVYAVVADIEEGCEPSITLRHFDGETMGVFFLEEPMPVADVPEAFGIEVPVPGDDPWAAIWAEDPQFYVLDGEHLIPAESGNDDQDVAGDAPTAAVEEEVSPRAETGDADDCAEPDGDVDAVSSEAVADVVVGAGSGSDTPVGDVDDAEPGPAAAEGDEAEPEAGSDGPEKLNAAVLLGKETEEFVAALDKPFHFLYGKMYGARDNKNTQDGEWTSMSMPLRDIIVGFDATATSSEIGFTRHPEAKRKEGDCIVLGTSIDGARQAKAMQTMYAMGIDIDSGASLTDVVKIIESKGLFCCVHTSFNHGKRGLQLKRDEVLRKLSIKTDPTVEQIHQYLREFDKNRYEESFIQQVTIKSAKTQVKSGVVIELDTPPLDKFRLIFPLAEPVEIVALGDTHQEALDAWEDAVTGMAHSVLGVHFDTSCTDPSRLFYTARHPKGSDDFFAGVVRGAPLDFDAIPRVKKATYAKNRDLNAFVMADDGEGPTKVPTVLTPSGASLNAYHTKGGKSGLMLADLLEGECPDKIRRSGGEKSGTVHTECPFEHEHSSEGGTATMAVNALDSESGYWTWFCHHDACQGRHKLEMLGEALARDWFPEEVLFDDAYLMPPEDEPDEEVEEERRAAAEAKAKGQEPAKPKTALEKMRALLAKDKSEAAIRKKLEQFEKTNAADKVEKTAITELIKAETGLTKRDIAAFWKDAEAAVKALAGPTEEDTRILVTDDFEKQITYVKKRLSKQNEADPFLFHYMDRLVTIEDDAFSEGKIRTFDERYMFNRLNQLAPFYKQATDKKVTHTSTPRDVIMHICAEPCSNYPALRGLVTSPTFSKSGQLIDKAGFHRESGLFYQPNHTLVIPPVSDAPTQEELNECLHLLIDEVYADFPIGGKTRKEIEALARSEEGLPAMANLLALTLLPFCRDMIVGPTPGHLLTKPAPGTGASLLTDVISLIATGEETPAMAMPTSTDEMAKTLTAVLSNGQQFVFFDNINHSVDSGELASAMTAPYYGARILGRSDTVKTEVRCAWILTGNNVTMSGELVRRLVMVDLDARVSSPESRSGFRHSDIRGYVKKNRGTLVWACLTLIQNWIAQGKEECGDQILASYENYSRVMGGILKAAGINGFMANKKELQQSADDDSTDVMDLLVAKWFETCGTKYIPLTDGTNKQVSVHSLVEAGELELPIMKSRDGDGYNTRALGRWIGQQKGRVYDLPEGPSVAVRQGPRQSKGVTWFLEPVSDAPVSNVEAA